MASAKGILAGQAFVRLFLDSGPLQQGLTIAQNKLKNWGQSITDLGQKVFAAGAAITSGLLASSLAFAEIGDKLEKAALRTGTTVEAFSALRYAAGQSGASFEDLENGIRKMQQTLADGKGIKELGIQAKELKSLKPEQQLSRIADAMSAVKDPAKKTAIAMQVFGKAGTKLIPLLDGGAEGIRELTDEAKEVGAVMSTKDAQAAAKLGDAVDRLKTSFTRIVVAVGSAVTPVFQSLLDTIQPVIASTGKWLQENRDLVVAVLAGGAATASLGLALLAVGKAFAVASAAVGGLKVILSTVVALFSPLGLLAGVIAGIGTAFVTLSSEGQTALTILTQSWQEISSVATTAWKGIVDALSSGDLALAGKIAFTGLKAVFFEGTQALQGVWLEFKSWAVGIWEALTSDIAALLITMWVNLQANWEGGLNLLADNFNAFIARLQQGWVRFTGFFEKAWVSLQETLGLADAGAADAVQQRIDAQIKAIAQERDAKHNALADQHNERMKQLESEKAAMLAVIDDQFAKDKAERDKAKQERLAELGKEMNAARAELEELTKQAANKRAEKASEVADNTDKQAAKTPSLGESVGTFSAFAALRMTGSQDRMPDLLEELIDIAEDQLAVTKETGLTFA